MAALILTVLPAFLTFTIASWRTGSKEDRTTFRTSRTNRSPKLCQG